MEMETAAERKLQRIALQPPQMKQVVRTQEISPSRRFALISRQIWTPGQKPNFQIQTTPQERAKSRPVIDMIGRAPERLAPSLPELQRQGSSHVLNTSKSPQALARPNISQLLIGEKSSQRVQAGSFSPSRPRKQHQVLQNAERLPLLPALQQLICLLPASFSDHPGHDAGAEAQKTAVLSTVCNSRFADELGAAQSDNSVLCSQSTSDFRSGYFDNNISKCARYNLSGSIQACSALAQKAAQAATEVFRAVGSQQPSLAALKSVVQLFLAAFAEDQKITCFFAAQRASEGQFFDPKMPDSNIRAVVRLVRAGFLDCLKRQIAACSAETDGARFGFFTFILSLFSLTAPCARDAADGFVSGDFSVKIQALLASNSQLSAECAVAAALLCRSNYNFALSIAPQLIGRLEAQNSALRDALDREEVRHVREALNELEMSDYENEEYDDSTVRGRLLNVIRKSGAANSAADSNIIQIQQAKRVEKHLLRSQGGEEQGKNLFIQELRKTLYLANICVFSLAQALTPDVYEPLVGCIARVLGDVEAQGVAFSQFKATFQQQSAFRLAERAEKARLCYLLSCSVFDCQPADLLQCYARVQRDQ